MRQFHPTSPVFVLIIPILLSACGKGAPVERDGFVARVDGVLVHVTDEEKSEVCDSAAGESVECEENYIYTASFGRSRPIPAPAPRPTATARPKPSPVPVDRELVDYSKDILKVRDAWKLTRGSREIVVAVVDSGVQLDHPDLKNNIWVNTAEKNGVAGVDDDGNGYVDDVKGYDFANGRADGNDDQGHGTHVAGTIGAEANGFGTVGVTPLVRIMPIKFLSADGRGSTLNAVKAIDYAVANGAHIISNSWGGGGRSTFLEEAIARAKTKGVVVVAAAGNGDAQGNGINNDLLPSYPASYAGVISVASTTSSDGLSRFSNYGKQTVAIAAPGSSIYSTYLGGTYDTLSGTSMATPQVSGAMALAMAYNSDLSSSELEAALCSSADRILTESTRCGRLNVLSLLESVR